MTTPCDIFDEYLASRPKLALVRLDRQRLHQSDLAHLAEYKEGLQALTISAKHRYPSLPVLNFYWLDEVDLNGIAIRYQNELFIGLTYGVVQSSYKLFNTMLSWPQVLPTVGDPLLEKAPAQQFRRRRRWGRIEEDRIDTIRPACPVRARYARHLENLVVEQFMFHEFTHIMHGHAGYFDSFRGPENVLVTRTTEMDADVGALSTQMSNIATRVLNKNSLPETFQLFYNNVTGSVFDLAFALASIFHIFENYFAVSLDMNLNKDSNTIFRLRLRMLIEWAMQFVNQFIGIEHHHSCGQAMLDGIEQARNAYALVTGETRDSKPISLPSGDPEWDHLLDLTNFWRSTLRSALEPYAYRELPRY
jgi:hypothetical protein